MQLKVKKLYEGAILPSYAKPGDAGMDLFCKLPAGIICCSILPGERGLISTGIAAEIPDGFEMQIRPRSGLALNKGLTVLNSPGTIDSGYRGEIGVILLNTGQHTVEIRNGDRIAQAVIAPVVRAEIVEVDELGKSERGAGGFGSTGQ